MGRNQEDRLTAWLRDRLGPGDLLGDDAAVLPPPPPGARLVATVDSQIAGVHHPADLDPALAARRLLAVNLSDVAAMGAEPRHALLALSGPAELDRERYFEGLLGACEEWGVTLAGGDLARTAETVIGTLTLLAELPAGREPLLRSGAKPGQGLWVGGTLGESAVGRELLARGARAEQGPAVTGEGAQIAKGGKDAGWRIDLPEEVPAELAEPARRAVRRHLDPLPQLALGRALAELPAGAAMDLSDGLGADLPRLCRASGAGAEIDAAALPRSPSFAALCTWLRLDPLDTALGGGEDYVLLFTLPEDAEPPLPATRIGRVTASPDLVLLEAGRPRPLPHTGWDHLRRGG
jgi:thiamine-monophosphate kinase